MSALPSRSSPAAVATVVVARMDVARLRVIAILAGGAIGAPARAEMSQLLPHGRGAWPWATFSVNIFGAALLAWLTTRLAEMVAPTRYWRMFLGTGFCGALTTFSTFQVETVRLVHEGHVGVALGYSSASMAAGMAVAVAATVVARRRRYG